MSEKATSPIVIENSDASYATGVKRFHAPCVVTSACPMCGEAVVKDLYGQEYLSYPSVNKPFTLWFYHEYQSADGQWDEHEWSSDVQVVLRVTLEVAEPK